MPKIASELTPIEIRNLPPGLHAVGGCAGLLIRVKPSGARNWVLRVTIGGKRCDRGIGGFPTVSLAKAREKAREAREQIEKGTDPAETRRKARERLRAERASLITFTAAMRRCFAAKEREFSNAKHRQQWINSLENYAAPVLGPMAVSDIETAHVMRVLEPLWAGKVETGTRVRQRIEQVLTWCTVQGFRRGDNPARWRGHLDQLLAKPDKIAKTSHFEALPIDEMPAFMAALRERDSLQARALELLALTATRSNEVRGAKWSEFDLQARTWTISADRMKARREHRVPLCDDAVDLLKKLPKLDPDGYLFPGKEGRPIIDSTILDVIRNMGYSATAHGLRSSFRTWAAERTAYPREVAEMALAHTVGDAVERAYSRGDLLEKRARLMADWAEFLRLPAATGDVVPLRAQA